MATFQFDSKTFNPEVFGRYTTRVPNLRRLEFINAGVFEMRPDLATMFPEQTGGNFATIPIRDYLKGTTVNYDGVTNITSNTQETFSQSIVVAGQAAGFTEKDFSYSMTGVDFYSDIAGQLVGWRQGVDEDTLLSTIKGIFAMTGAGNSEFVDKHTTEVDDFGVTTLNTAMQKASGDNRSQFTLTIMNSMIMTRLENMNLLEFLKYTDANGVTRNLGMGTINGRLALEDDTHTTQGEGASLKYVSYVFGRNAFINFDAPVLHPYSMDRDEALNGGQTTLYTRFRRCYAPRGISFTKNTMATNSPTDAELATGANWELVNNGKSTSAKRYFNHRAIPIARIITN